MRKWKSKINGKNLRDVIKSGDEFETLKVLVTELHFKIKRITDIDEMYEYEDLYELVKSDVEIGKEELLEYVKQNEWSLNELVDDRLCQFYDLCDKYDVWISV